MTNCYSIRYSCTGLQYSLYNSVVLSAVRRTHHRKLQPACDFRLFHAFTRDSGAQHQHRLRRQILVAHAGYQGGKRPDDQTLSQRWRRALSLHDQCQTHTLAGWELTCQKRKSDPARRPHSASTAHAEQRTGANQNSDRWSHNRET